MITQEQALHSIHGQSAEEIFNLSIKRLRGMEMSPIGHYYFNEQPEELLIQLLLTPNLGQDIRSAIIHACKIIYGESLRILAEESPLDGIDPFLRLCQVVDVASPIELFNHANSAMALIWNKENIPLTIRAEAVGAAMGYAYSEADVPFWERILDTPEFAAYGFTVLLQINPSSPKIEEYLLQLWSHQIFDGWKVDTAFLMRRASIERDKRKPGYGMLSIVELFDFLQINDDIFWQKIKNILYEKTWSKKWIDDFEAYEKPLKKTAG